MNILTKFKGGDASTDQFGGRAFLVPERSEFPELLDQGEGSAKDVSANLTEMWRINRVFGGLHALTSHLFPAMKQAEAPLRLVDIGTGDASLPHHIAEWASRNNLQLEIYAVDIARRNLGIAQTNLLAKPNIRLVQADATALPFANSRIDYYISSLFLHHLSPDEIVQLLSVIYQRVRRGIIMSDLVRHYLPLAAFRLIRPIFARNYLTRHDGYVSIHRAYTANELRILAHRAGIGHAQVFQHFPWRATLVVKKAHV